MRFFCGLNRLPETKTRTGWIESAWQCIQRLTLYKEMILLFPFLVCLKGKDPSLPFCTGGAGGLP